MAVSNTQVTRLNYIREWTSPPQLQDLYIREWTSPPQLQISVNEFCLSRAVSSVWNVS